MSASGGETALGATVFPRPSLPVFSCAFSPRRDGDEDLTEHTTPDLRAALLLYAHVAQGEEVRG